MIAYSAIVSAFLVVAPRSEGRLRVCVDLRHGRLIGKSGIPLKSSTERIADLACPVAAASALETRRARLCARAPSMRHHSRPLRPLLQCAGCLKRDKPDADSSASLVVASRRSISSRPGHAMSSSTSRYLPPCVASASSLTRVSLCANATVTSSGSRVWPWVFFQFFLELQERAHAGTGSEASTSSADRAASRV